jgi:hypothetical protein
MLRQGITEGIFETAEIHIAGGTVKVSLEVQSSGTLGTDDYVKFYKIVDGKQPVQIGKTLT